MGTAEPVKPMTWQRAALRDSRVTGSPAVALTASLVVVSPGKPDRSRPAEAQWDFFASVPVLMQLTRLCERSVRGALADMQRLGYLHQVKRGGWRNDRAEASTWRLTIPEHAPGADSETTADPRAESRNMHEKASEHAPDDGPRAEVIQERSSSVTALRIEGATPDANDEMKSIEDETEFSGYQTQTQKRLANGGWRSLRDWQSGGGSQ